MNPFKNQIVNLSAGDAIKNKKDRHIYSAAKKQFEVKVLKNDLDYFL